MLNLGYFGHDAMDSSKSEREQSARWRTLKLGHYQYFRTTISDGQHEEFGHLVQDSIRRIEAAEFLPHSGIRFPAEPLHQLSLHRVVPGAAGFDRSGAGAASRSRRPWLA